MADPKSKFSYLSPSAWSRRYDPSFFTANVIGYQKVINKDGCFCSPVEFAEYDVECSVGKKNWVVHRRFSEWFKLWEDVKAHICQDEGFPIPIQPNKTCGHNLAESFLESRVDELSLFLDSILIQYNSFTDIEQKHKVENFLLLDKYENESDEAKEDNTLKLKDSSSKRGGHGRFLTKAEKQK